MLSEREGTRVRGVNVEMCAEWGVCALVYHINRVEFISTCLYIEGLIKN